MTPLIIFAVCLFVAGGLWLLVEMFRASVWWGIFGLLFPPVQVLFVLVHWGRAWRPLLLQTLGLLLLLVGVWRDPDVRIQECWYQVIQQTAAAVPAVAKPVAGEAAAVMPALEEDLAREEEPAQPAAATGKTIYRCEDAHGKVTFTDQACAGNSKTVDSLPVVEPEPSSASLLDKVFARPATSDVVTGDGFACDGRTHCSQMTSCAEARFFLANCPGVKMDGGGDGVPCESQWCGD